MNHPSSLLTPGGGLWKRTDCESAITNARHGEPRLSATKNIRSQAHMFGLINGPQSPAPPPPASLATRPWKVSGCLDARIFSAAGHPKSSIVIGPWRSTDPPNLATGHVTAGVGAPTCRLALPASAQVWPAPRDAQIKIVRGAATLGCWAGLQRARHNSNLVFGNGNSRAPWPNNPLLLRL